MSFSPRPNLWCPEVAAVQKPPPGSSWRILFDFGGQKERIDPTQGLVGVLDRDMYLWSVRLHYPLRGTPLRRLVVHSALQNPEHHMGREQPYHERTGLTLLHWCAAHGEVELVEKLLRAGYHVDQPSCPPFSNAYQRAGWWNGLFRPFCHGPSAQPLVQGETALHHAAARNQGAVVNLLLRKGASSWARTSQDQRFPHQWASTVQIKIILWVHWYLSRDTESPAEPTE